MEKLKALIAHLIDNYPYKFELSKARLTKMVYLCDWLSAYHCDKQITDIKWFFNHYGPYVDDVVNCARNNPEFEILIESNCFGSTKEVIKAREALNTDALNTADKRIIDFVIGKTAGLNWNNFIDLVYSTYPIATQPRYTYLDLENLAKKCKARNNPELININ